MAAVEGIAATARTAVKSAAEQALAAGTQAAIMDFLRTGLAAAATADNRQAVFAILAVATPAVAAAAQVALTDPDPAGVVEFLRTGQYTAAAQDAAACSG